MSKKQENEDVQEMETGRGWDRPQREGPAIWRVPVILHVRANDLPHAKEIVRAGMNASVGLVTGLVGFELAGDETTINLDASLSTDWVLIEQLGSYFRLEDGALIGAPVDAKGGVNVGAAVVLRPEEYEGQERANLRVIRRDLLTQAQRGEVGEAAGSVTVEGRNAEEMGEQT